MVLVSLLGVAGRGRALIRDVVAEDAGCGRRGLVGEIGVARVG